MNNIYFTKSFTFFLNSFTTDIAMLSSNVSSASIESKVSGSKKKKNRIIKIHENEFGRMTLYRAFKSEFNLSTKTQQSTITKSEMSLYGISVSNVSMEAEDDEPPPSYFYLKQLEVNGFASVVEDVIQQIYILEHCNTDLHIRKTLIDMDELKSIKYGIELPEVTDELAGIDIGNLGSDEYKIQKLEKDRTLIKNAMINLYKDLCCNQSFIALVRTVEALQKEDHDYQELIKDEENNRQLRRDLAKELRQQRNHQKSQMYETDVIIDTLKTNVEDAALNASIRSRYIKNWENSRSEQHKQKIDDVETPPLDEIEKFKQKIDQEERAHSEFKNIINTVIDDRMEQIEEWMDKYDYDFDELEKNIEDTTNKYNEAVAKKEKLQKTIAKHKVEIAAWLEFVETRERERQYREKMNKAALAVQSWWRAMLVRKELGPFRVKGKKGPKPKDEKEGKGKKKK